MQIIDDWRDCHEEKIERQNVNEAAHCNSRVYKTNNKQLVARNISSPARTMLVVVVRATNSI